MTEVNEKKFQNDLVEDLIENGYIQSPEIADAFRTVPRHLFTPGVPLERVYSDTSIPTKRADGKLLSSSSQPAIMAIMLEQLDLQPDHRVLEIGAGTGFNAGLIRHLVGDTGLVVTVDIDDDIVTDAREHLRAAGMDDVRVICGDGGLGCAVHGPYDRIIITAGAGDISPEWREQLKPGGRLLLPLELCNGIQESVAFDLKDGCFESVSLKGCGFIRLRGIYANKPNILPLGPDPGLNLTMKDGYKADKDSVYAMLNGSFEDRSFGVRISLIESVTGLSLWLMLREPDVCSISAEGKAAEQNIIPRFFVYGGGAAGYSTGGLISDETICLFTRPSDTGDSYDEKFELSVRSYGSATELAERLIEQVRSWVAAGRPSIEGLSIRAYPIDTGYKPGTDEYLIQKQWTDLILKWG